MAMRTRRQLHVFASSSDWFAVFTSVVIGQSYYFGLGFTTLNSNCSTLPVNA